MFQHHHLVYHLKLYKCFVSSFKVFVLTNLTFDILIMHYKQLRFFTQIEITPCQLTFDCIKICKTKSSLFLFKKSRKYYFCGLNWFPRNLKDLKVFFKNLIRKRQYIYKNHFNKQNFLFLYNLFKIFWVVRGTKYLFIQCLFHVRLL